MATIWDVSKVDIHTAVAVASALHQNYEGFLPDFRKKVLEDLAGSYRHDTKKELRINLRYVTGLVLAGVLPDNDLGKVVGIINKIAAEDEGRYAYVAVIVSYCKTCGREVAGLVSRKIRELSKKYDTTLDEVSQFGPKVEEKVKARLLGYYTAMAKTLAAEHKQYQRQVRKNEISVELHGELKPEKQTEFEEKFKEYEKLLLNTGTLSDLLDEPMPELPEYEDELLTSMNVDISNPYKDADQDGVRLWDDSETRDFYTTLTDLRAHVPPSLWNPKTADPMPEEDASAEAAGEEGEKDELEAELDPEGDDDAEDPEAGSGGDEASEAEGDNADDSAAPLPSEKDESGAAEWGEGLTETDPMMLFINDLPMCVNARMIDDMAVKFISQGLNHKGNRRRLALALHKVSRSRVDLLPFYSRFVATLYPGIPDLAEDLVGHLQGEFRFFVKKNSVPDIIEQRLKNARFIGELTKFGMAPPKVVLNCLVVLVRSFKGHNIDVMCTILETCGRFLFRSGDTHVRTKNLLDIIQKKRMALHLDALQISMIDNAKYYCNPPEAKQAVRKVRPVVHEYLRYILYKQLNSINVDAMVLKLRKFPWNEPEFHTCAFYFCVATFRLALVRAQSGLCCLLDLCICSPAILMSASLPVWAGTALSASSGSGRPSMRQLGSLQNWWLD